MVKGILRLTLLVALWSATLSAWACTGFYVGKRVSSDGTTLLGRTVDHGAMAACARQLVVPRVENVPGRVLKGRCGFEWPLPATTWKYVATPFQTSAGCGDFACAAANERGFTVTATVTGHLSPAIRKAFPPAPHGCAEDNITGLLVASCANVPEALELIAEVMAKKGTREPNVIMLADQREAWLVETYTTNLWAAMRLPADKVAGFGNHFVLEAYDPSSPDWRAAPEIESAPASKGLAVRTYDGRLHLHRTYDGPRFDSANIRSWFAHRLMAPGTEGVYAAKAELPSFFAPSRKLGVRDIISFMRTRYEGTGLCPEDNGRDDVRIIGDESQATCHVISIHDDLPADRATVIWSCLGASEHSVFLPLANCITATDSAFSADNTNTAGRVFVPELAGDAFYRLAALAQSDRLLYGRGVRDHWAEREDELFAGWPSVYARGDAAEMTAFTMREQARAFADARQMTEEILFLMVKNGRTWRWVPINGHPLPVPRTPYRAFDAKGDAPDLTVSHGLSRGEFDRDERASDVVAKTNLSVFCRSRYGADAAAFESLWRKASDAGELDRAFAELVEIEPRDEIQRFDLVDIASVAINTAFSKTKDPAVRLLLAKAGATVLAVHPSASVCVRLDRLYDTRSEKPFDWRKALEAEDGSRLPRYAEFAAGWFVPLVEQGPGAAAELRREFVDRGIEAYRPQTPRTLATFRRAVGEARVAAAIAKRTEGGR